MNKVSFKERQFFGDKMVYLLLAGGILGAISGLVKSIVYGNSSVITLMSYMSIALLFGCIVWWLLRLRFKVSINHKRIKYKMSPIHKKAQRISWGEVESCQIIKTPLAAQWHGGNVRFSGESWFSLTGRNGLSIVTKDGRRLFIGCEDVDKLSDTFDRFPTD